MRARVTVFTWSLTRTALPLRTPSPRPEAAVRAAAPPALTLTGDALTTGVESATRDAADHLNPTVVPLLTPGLAPTPAATGDPLAVAVTTITNMAADAAAVPRHAATGPTPAPTAAPLHQTSTHIVDATGPDLGLTPGLQAG